MNPIEETNLRAEISVLRAMVKCLIGLLPADQATTDALDSAAKHVVEAAPQMTQERVATQRAVNQIAPLEIPRK